jgi:hypothetical protein
MVTTTKRTTHAWMIALVAVAMALALMLGIGLVDPHGSAATTAAAGSGQPSARRPDTTCALAWRVVSSPPGNSGSLEAVAAVSTDDAWAVGYECLADDCDSHTVLTMHWDGATWSIVPSPNGGNLGELQGVAAISTDDVWAVGGSDNGALTMHWDGSNWTVVPNPGPSTSSLSAVAAVAADDVWAVGRSPSGALTMHWSGTSWSAVPNLSIHGALFAVALVAA